VSCALPGLGRCKSKKKSPLVFLVVGLATFPLSLSVLFKTGILAATGAFGVFSSLTFVSLVLGAGVIFALVAVFETGASFFFTGSSFSSELLSELEDLKNGSPLLPFLPLKYVVCFQ
jgi:hypothetical protein